MRIEVIVKGISSGNYGTTLKLEKAIAPTKALTAAKINLSGKLKMVLIEIKGSGIKVSADDDVLSKAALSLTTAPLRIGQLDSSL